MAIEIKEEWYPMPLQMGPPLPRSMQVYWPWVKRPPEEAPPEVPVPPGLPPPPVEYRLYVYTVGKGTVTPTDGAYPAGSVVTLTARPGYGAAFDHWAGDVSGTNPMANITMDRSKSATAYFKAVAPPPYEEEPPPEEIPPLPPAPPPPPPAPPAAAKFYMPSTLTIREEGPYNGFYKVTFSTRITNRGDAPERYDLTWGSNYLTASPYLPGYGAWEEETSRRITIQPGETYYWSWTYEEVFDFYRGYFTCQLKGEWEGDNKAVGIWR